MANIAVLGAGLVGRFTALLLEQTHQVTLFEKACLKDENTTGRVAAAMLAPVSEAVDASDLVVSMGLASLSLWPRLLATLELNVPVNTQGTLVVAHRQDEGDMRNFEQRVGATTSVPTGMMTRVDREAINALEPELGNGFNHGVFIPCEGHVNNAILFEQTSHRLQNSSVVVRENTAVSASGNQVESNLGKHEFDLVIDCRGLGAKTEWQNPSSSLRGVRGEVIRVRAPEVHLTRQVRLMHPRYPLYIVPKGQHEFVIGATQIESDSNKAITLRSALELLSAAYSLHSGFAEAEILSMQASLRPTLSDNEPQITVSNGSIQVNGLYRHGYLITPYVLSELLSLLKTLGLSSAHHAFCNDAPPLSCAHQLVVHIND